MDNREKKLKLYRTLERMNIGDMRNIFNLASEEKLSPEETIECLKWLIDNGHDKVNGFMIEFTSDYRNVVKKESFSNQIRQAYFDYIDNENFKKNYGKKSK